MSLRGRFRFGSGPRRIVFWASGALMLAAALFGLIWVLVADSSLPAIAALTLGLGALLFALVFGLLEFTSPTFHPESELFAWSDVDGLRDLARRAELDPASRELAQSLADRVAIVLPGRTAEDTQRAVANTAERRQRRQRK